MFVITKRYLSLIVGCVIASAIFAFFKANVKMNEIGNSIYILDFLLLLLYFMYSGFTVRYVYFNVDDSFDYYLYNIVAIVFFFGTVMIFKIIFTPTVFEWLFSLTDVFIHILSGVGSTLSLGILCVLILICDFLSETIYNNRM